MDNKDMFLAMGFIILFLIFFYAAISKVTHYLDEIGEEIDNILSDSEAPVTLVPELRPISEKLNTLKMKMCIRDRPRTPQDTISPTPTVSIMKGMGRLIP